MTPPNTTGERSEEKWTIQLRLTDAERRMALRHLRQPGGTFSRREMEDGTFDAFCTMLDKLAAALIEPAPPPPPHKQTSA